MLAVLAWWPLFPAVLLAGFMFVLLIFDPSWAACFKDRAILQKLGEPKNRN